MGLGPRDWWQSVKSWVCETFGGGSENQHNDNSNSTSQSTDTALPGGKLPEVVVEADRIIQPIADHEPIQGPEFSGDIWDWLNKVENFPYREWTDEYGVSWVIDNQGNIVRPSLTTGVAPSPGRAKRSAYQKAKFLRELQKSGKAPKWMNNWLSPGKVPPGHQVDHKIPLSVGGADVPANMRLNTTSNHRLHHKLYRPWRKN